MNRSSSLFLLFFICYYNNCITNIHSLQLFPPLSTIQFPKLLKQTTTKKEPVRRVAIIGTGIAGLSLAHALENSPSCAQTYLDACRRRKNNSSKQEKNENENDNDDFPFGIQTMSFDSRPSLDFEAGAGFQMNGGLSVLGQINPILQSKVIEASLPLKYIRSRTKPWWKGNNNKNEETFQTLFEINLEKIIQNTNDKKVKEALLDEDGKPPLVYTMMRGALQEILSKQLPSSTTNRVHFGKTLIGIRPQKTNNNNNNNDNDDGLLCEFADGSIYGPFDLIIGCDGIKSAVKEYIDTNQISLNPIYRKGRAASIYSGLRVQFAVQDGDDDNNDNDNDNDDENISFLEWKQKGAEFRQYFGDSAYGLDAMYGAGSNRPPTKVGVLVYRDDGYIGPFKKGQNKNDDGSATTTTTITTKSEVEDENIDWTQDNPSFKKGQNDNDNEDTTTPKQSCLNRIYKSGIYTKDLCPTIEQSHRIFELGIYFHNPFRLWNGWSRQIMSSSGSGSGSGGSDKYCVLSGDAAHAMPPFLGQGSNQAIQDAYCLSKKIFEYNAACLLQDHDDDDYDEEEEDVNLSLDLGKLLRDYEHTRWLPTTSISLKACVLGYLETGDGFFAKFRDVFFFITGSIGVATKVFLDSAIPVV